MASHRINDLSCSVVIDKSFVRFTEKIGEVSSCPQPANYRCTCFGVTEERLEGVIRGLKDPSVEAVGDVCNAGMGCGSCRMLIEEMIDGKIG